MVENKSAQSGRRSQRVGSVFYSSRAVAATEDAVRAKRLDRTKIFGATSSTKKPNGRKMVSSRSSFRMKVSPEPLAQENDGERNKMIRQRTTFLIGRHSTKRRESRTAELSTFAKILEKNYFDVGSHSKLVILPTSWVHVIWNIAILLTSVTMLTSIPYFEAFAIVQQSSEWLQKLWPASMIVDVILLVDIYLRMNHLAFRSRVGLMVQRANIRVSYVFSWSFVIDILSALPLTTIGLYYHSKTLRVVGNLCKGLRILKIYSYAGAIFHFWLKKFHKGKVGFGRSIRRMSKLISMVIVVSYVLGCLFFALSYLETYETHVSEDSYNLTMGAGTRRRLSTHPFTSSACDPFCFVPESTDWDLVTALYFSLQTLFTVGYGDVFPESPTALQVIFTNFAVLCGAVAHALVIANISSLLKNLDITGAAFRRQMNQLQVYAKDRRLSSNLQAKLTEYFDYLWVRQRGRMDRQLLQDLPRTLRDEMTFAKRACLFRIPLFRKRNAGFLDAVVSCLQRIIVTQGQVFAKEGDAVDNVYFLIDGKVQILGETQNQDETSLPKAKTSFTRTTSQFIGIPVENNPNEVVVGEILPGAQGVIGENCLFDEYATFLYSFRARITCEFQVLSADAFNTLLQKFSAAVLHSEATTEEVAATMLQLRSISGVEHKDPKDSMKDSQLIISKCSSSVVLKKLPHSASIRAEEGALQPPRDTPHDAPHDPPSAQGRSEAVSSKHGISELSSTGSIDVQQHSKRLLKSSERVESSRSQDREPSARSHGNEKSQTQTITVNHRPSRFLDESGASLPRKHRVRSTILSYNELPVNVTQSHVEARRCSTSSAAELDESGNVPKQTQRDIDAVASMEVAHMLGDFRAKRKSFVSSAIEFDAKDKNVIPVVPIINSMHPDRLVTESMEKFKSKVTSWNQVMQNRPVEKPRSSIFSRKTSYRELRNSVREMRQSQSAQTLRRLNSVTRVESDDACLPFLAMKSAVQRSIFKNRRDRIYHAFVLVLYVTVVIWDPIRIAYHPLRVLPGIDNRTWFVTQDLAAIVVETFCDAILVMTLLLMPSLEAQHAIKRNKFLVLDISAGNLVTDVHSRSRAVSAMVITLLSLTGILTYAAGQTLIWAIVRCFISAYTARHLPKQLTEVVLQLRNFKLETMFAVALQMATVVLIILHWSTCGWITISHISPIRDTAAQLYEAAQVPNASAAGELAEQLDASALGYSGGHQAEWYAYSFYWALVSVATVGFGDILAETLTQRIYAMVTILLGATLYAGFISILAAIAHHIEVYEDHIEHVSNCIQTYMLNREFPRDLVDKCMAYLDYEVQECRTLKDKVVLNTMVPDMLRRGILDEILGETVSSAPLFADAPAVLDAAVVDSLHSFTFCPGDLIVSPVTGNDGVHAGFKRAMVFLKKGSAEVLSETGMSVSVLKSGDSFGSINLFKPEKQQLKLRALSYCEVWALFSHDMDSILERFMLDGTIESVDEVTQSLVEKAEQLMDKAGGNVAKNLHNAKLNKLMQTEEENNGSNVEKNIWLPNSRKYKTWHLVMSTCVFYNLGGIPYRVAFLDGPALNQVVLWIIMDCITDLGYLTDIYLRDRHLAIDGSTVVAKRSEISSIYRAFDMKLDIIASLPVGLLLIIFKTDISIAVYAAARMITVLRGRRIQFYRDLIQSSLPINESVQRVVILFLAILASAHWSGSLFFLLARQLLQYDPQITVWTNMGTAPVLLEAMPNGTVDVIPDSLVAYSWSVYWSVATLTTVGYGDYHAANTAEVIYSTFLLVLGGFIYAILLSSLEEIVAQSDISSILFQRQMDTLNDYIALRKLPRDLNVRLVSYQQMLWTRQKGVEEAWLHKRLPLMLRRQICHELMGSTVYRKIPLFKEWGELDAFLDMLVPATFVERTALCLKGEMMHRMFIIVSGKAELVSDDGQKVYTSVMPGDLVGELSFFYKEPAQCAVRIVTQTDVLAIDRETFDAWLEKSKDMKGRFEKEIKEIEDELRKRCGLEAFTKNLNKAKVGKMFQDEGEVKTHMGDFVMLPDHRFRRWWNVVFLVTVSYQTIAAPYCAVFFEGYYVSSWLVEPFKVCDAFFDLLMLVDIVLNARYFTRVHKGVMLKTRREILPAYVRSGMVLDIISLLPLGSILNLFMSMTLANLAQFRLLRLLSIRRAPSAFQSCEEFAQEKNIHVKAGYRKLLAMLLAGLLSIHIIACIRGKINNTARPSRTQTMLFTEENFNATMYAYDDVFMEYIRCQFWAFYTITTVGFGNEPVEHPVFAIFCMLFGTFLCDAGVTATMSNMISNEEAKDGSMKQRSDSIMQYLQSNKVAQDTEKKVLEYLNFQVEKQLSLDERAILSNVSVPEHLRIEIVSCVALEVAPNLSFHPSIVGFGPGLLQSMASLLEPEVVVSGISLFSKVGDDEDSEDKSSKGSSLYGSYKFALTTESHTSKQESLGREETSLYFMISGKVAIKVGRNAKVVRRGVLSPSSGIDAARTLETSEFFTLSMANYKKLNRYRTNIGGQYENLKDLLEDEASNTYFRAHLQASHCEKDFDLYYSIVEYKKKAATAENERRTTMARSICDTFLKPTTKGTTQLKVLPAFMPPREFSKLVEQIDSGSAPENVFDSVSKALLEGFEVDFLDEFMLSKGFYELILGEK